MKIKSKITISKDKRLKVSREDTKIISEFERELLKDLYGFASGGKSKTKIVLAELKYSEEYNAKVKLLDKLKRQKIIKKYLLLKQPEKVEFFPPKPRKPSKFEIEVNPEVLLQQIPGDYDEAYLCNASIEFDPKKIIKYYQKICRKEIVEEGFKNEKVLTCDELRFGLETGNVIYKYTITNFLPDKQEYNVLKVLMEKTNKRVDHKTLCGIAFGDQRTWKPNQSNTSIKRDIGFIIRNIKSKLEILNGKNKNLISPCNGYRMAGDS